MVATYDEAFFESIRSGARSSADVIVPLLLEHLPAIGSVVDVGCAEGTFLAAFQRHGVQDILGLDGDWVDRAQLEIPVARFEPADLNQPIRIDRRFDLAISLEAAEHLRPERAESFVSDLIRLAPMVVFSAAIPGQGGADHLNERWQDEWAVEFRAHGFQPIDFLRQDIWGNDQVMPWYAQNIMVYATPERLSGPLPHILRVVHPDVLSYQVAKLHRASISKSARSLCHALLDRLRRELGN